MVEITFLVRRTKGRGDEQHNWQQELLVLLVFFETSLITSKEPRYSDLFNRMVVELEKKMYSKDTWTSGNETSVIIRRTGLKSSWMWTTSLSSSHQILFAFDYQTTFKLNFRGYNADNKNKIRTEEKKFTREHVPKSSSSNVQRNIIFVNSVYTVNIVREKSLLHGMLYWISRYCLDVITS